MSTYNQNVEPVFLITCLYKIETLKLLFLITCLDKIETLKLLFLITRLHNIETLNLFSFSNVGIRSKSRLNVFEFSVKKFTVNFGWRFYVCVIKQQI
jgi:hypothetical protein